MWRPNGLSRYKPHFNQSDLSLWLEVSKGLSPLQIGEQYETSYKQLQKTSVSCTKFAPPVVATPDFLRSSTLSGGDMSVSDIAPAKGKPCFWLKVLEMDQKEPVAKNTSSSSFETHVLLKHGALESRKPSTSASGQIICQLLDCQLKPLLWKVCLPGGRQYMQLVWTACDIISPSPH